MDCNFRYVSDDDLGYYFQKLHRYLTSSIYYNSSDKELKKTYHKRNDKINTSRDINGTKMKILSVPARKVQQVAIKKLHSNECPLCINLRVSDVIAPYNKLKGLLWKNYIIIPNAFPYFKVHYLLLGIYHDETNTIGTQNDAHLYSYVVGNAIEFIRIIKKGTILFNGWVGNSLSHLHFHYTSTIFPIKEIIKQHNLKKQSFATKNGSKIILFSDTNFACKNFLCVKSSSIKICDDIYKLLNYIISSLKLFYNLCIYFDGDTCFTFIFIRQKIEDDRFSFGASHLSGLVMLSEDDINKYKKNKRQFVDSLNEYCSRTVKETSFKNIQQIFRND